LGTGLPDQTRFSQLPPEGDDEVEDDAPAAII
jgi:hypothetical protein